MMHKSKEARLFVCLCCLTALVWFSIRDAKGEMTHRYSFSEKTLHDSTGGEDGQCPVVSEELQYGDDVPPQAVGVSLNFENVGEGKLVGFALPGRVLRQEKGSYALWIKPIREAGIGNDFILSAVPLNQGVSLVIFQESSKLLANVNGTNIGPFPLVPSSDWHHVAVVWDSTNGSGEGSRAWVYVNGEIAGSAAIEGTISSSTVNCGAFAFADKDAADGSTYADSQYRGLIYDLQIHDEPLTPGQIEQLHKNPGLTLDVLSGDSLRSSEP